MNNSQQLALEALVGRVLTTDEITALDPHVAARQDGSIADILSVGRKKVNPTEIGAGTILAVLGDGGGTFLDTLVTIGEVNRNVYWTMDLIKQGRLRIDMPAVKVGMQQLATAVPALAGAISVLLALGYVADPVPVAAVSNALNAVEA